MDKKVTSGKVWRRDREEGVLITLPSGKTARIRPVEFELAAKSGNIPDFLTPIVEAMINGQKITPADVTKNMGVAKMMAAERELKEIFARAALVDPKIVDDPVADDEISTDDLDGIDLQFIMEVCQMPSDELRRFSEQQDSGVEPMADSNVVPEEAQPDGGAEPVVAETDGNPG